MWFYADLIRWRRISSLSTSVRDHFKKWPTYSREVAVDSAPMNEALHRHGRMASHPREIPWRGWWDIMVRVSDSVSRDNISLISAGLAMYGLLAVFPGFAATVSLYGLLVTPAAVVKQIGVFSQQM